MVEEQEGLGECFDCASDHQQLHDRIRPHDGRSDLDVRLAHWNLCEDHEIDHPHTFPMLPGRNDPALQPYDEVQAVEQSVYGAWAWVELVDRSYQPQTIFALDSVADARAGIGRDSLKRFRLRSTEVHTDRLSSTGRGCFLLSLDRDSSSVGPYYVVDSSDRGQTKQACHSDRVVLDNLMTDHLAGVMALNGYRMILRNHCCNQLALEGKEHYRTTPSKQSAWAVFGSFEVLQPVPA